MYFPGALRRVLSFRGVGSLSNNSSSSLNSLGTARDLPVVDVVEAAVTTIDMSRLQPEGSVGACLQRHRAEWLR